MSASPACDQPWPPAEMTTYCLPSGRRRYVAGDELAVNGIRVRHSSSPLLTSKARKNLSVVAAMKNSPPAVTTPPPRFGAPWENHSGNGAWSRVVPSTERHAILPVARSTAVSVPHGGGLHGAPKFDSSGMRLTP